MGADIVSASYPIKEELKQIVIINRDLAGFLSLH